MSAAINHRREPSDKAERQTTYGLPYDNDVRVPVMVTTSHGLRAAFMMPTRVHVGWFWDFGEDRWRRSITIQGTRVKATGEIGVTTESKTVPLEELEELLPEVADAVAEDAPRWRVTHDAILND